MPIIDLTQAVIATLACPPGKLKEEFVDRLVPGHLLEVRSATPGQGTWRYRQKVDGRMLHTKLGTTDSLTLAESRKKARALRAAYDRSDNPHEEAKARKAMITLDEFWLEHYLPYATPGRSRSKGTIKFPPTNSTYSRKAEDECYQSATTSPGNDAP
jgi:hypothetical protein